MKKGSDEPEGPIEPVAKEAEVSELGSDTRGQLDKLYGRSLAEVYKEFLPYFSRCYRVIPYEACHEPSDPAESVASFDITKLVMEANGRPIEKLKNVYQMLANTENSLALLVRRTPASCKVSLAVGSKVPDSEETINLARSIRDALLGSFPGSDCEGVVPFSDSGGMAFFPLSRTEYFRPEHFDSIGVVSNVATDYSEAFRSQGIEKLIDGIQLGEDEEYTVVLLARSLSPQELMRRKNRLYDLYTALSPFSQVQRGWGTQESRSWSQNVGAAVFAGTFPAVPSLGASLNVGLGHSSTKGVTSSNSVTITEYGVYHTLESIKKQIERIEQCEALGLWQFAAYVLSPDYRIVNEVSRQYLSLTQGKGSFYERPAINIWNALAGHGEQQREIEEIRNYLVHLEHPLFQKVGTGHETATDDENFNQRNWPERARCVSEISGDELTRSLNLPTHSIPGLPVIECAPFGREVSSYDSHSSGDVELGCIHHMHHDEGTPVRLSSSSLASHVFVTGSTGSGKSNTVYKLLDEAKCNFLVIEPAKGEYRFAVGEGARYFGTNRALGELLHINPFVFPAGVHVYEHVDRILEVFNVCWPMYAAMPAVLKDAVIRAYEKVGWDLNSSVNRYGALFPTFGDVCEEIDRSIVSSDYSDDTKGDYRGSLKTRLSSLSNGINRSLFCEGQTPDEDLFEGKTIVDLSRVGSAENKSLIMGILIIKLVEHRMSQHSGSGNEEFKHLTVLEEAHNILRCDSASSSPEMGGGLEAKSVEMIANAIAEMRTYGEGFVIVDQAPGLVDKSAIRNTNTKIIMRLPDEEDRELVGKAANLNDGQIRELARLQRGVAAIYQNEWIEPVLCHIARHEDRPMKETRPGHEDAGEVLNEDERRYLNACLYDPYYLMKPSEFDFDACVERSSVPDSLKALMFEYARMPMSRRKRVYGKLCFDYFGIVGLADRAGDSVPSDWDELLREHLRELSFPDDVEMGSDSPHWKLFSSASLAELLNWVDSNLDEPERTETAECLRRLAWRKGH